MKREKEKQLERKKAGGDKKETANRKTDRDTRIKRLIDRGKGEMRMRVGKQTNI